MPFADIAMETAVRPVSDASHQPVFYRIVMDIIDVPFEIDVVANSVLPVTTLPQRIFTALVFRSAAAFRNKTTEQTFAALPTPRIIGVVRGQGGDDVQMIRKHDDGVNRKRALLAGHATACRNRSIFSISAPVRRSASAAVKKNVPPGTNFAGKEPCGHRSPDGAERNPGRRCSRIPRSRIALRSIRATGVTFSLTLVPITVTPQSSLR